MIISIIKKVGGVTQHDILQPDLPKSKLKILKLYELHSLFFTKNFLTTNVNGKQ